MTKIKRIHPQVWFGAQLVILAIAIGSSIVLGAVVQNTPNVCFNASCAAGIKNSLIPEPAPIVATSTPVTPIDKPVVHPPVTVAPVAMTPAQVRGLIVNTYNQYMAQMTSYIATTYPTWASLNAANANWISQNTDGETKGMDANAFIQYEGQSGIGTVGGEITADIEPKIASEILNFCDLNSAIATQDEVAYCHTTFNPDTMRVDLMK